MTVVGAVILFLTFVVKDELRGDLSDAVRVVDSAGEQYLFRISVDTVLAEVREIRTTLESMAPEKSARNSVDDLYFTSTGRTGEMLHRGQQNSMNSLMSVDLLSSSLDWDDAEGDGLRERAYGALGDSSATLVTISDRMVTWSQARVDNRDVGDDFRRGVNESVEKYLEQMNVTNDALASYIQGVIRRATSIRDSKDRWYKRVNILSYVLYTVGWTLTLLGQLFGAVPGEPLSTSRHPG